MTYAYDNYIQLPTVDLYDTNMMAMAINAAKDMYDRGQQQIKDFYKEYGDFMSPFAKDMEAYGNMVGGVRNLINTAYANGIDLLRSPEGRALINKAVYSVDPAKFNMLRQSAQNATEFLKARKQLEAQGLYNPLLAKYDSPDMSTYSTLDDGVWDKMSPTRITDMATFGNPYFEGMKPNVRRESKNGITYSVESITPEDLTRIANDHFNELVSTPQGQLMYKYYADTLGEDKARDAFNAAVAAGQSRRIYTKDDYDDNYYKAESLKLQRSSNDLAWQKFYWDKDKEQQELDIKRDAANNTSEKDLDGFSLAQRWFDKAQANAWSADGITKQWKDMKDRYGEFGQSVDKIFHDFGQRVVKTSKTGTFNNDLYNKDVRKAYHEANRSGKYTQEQLMNGDYPKPSKDDVKYYSGNSYRSRISKYEQTFSFDMDPTSVASAIGGPSGTISGNGRVVQATDADVPRLYGVNDYVSNTAGFTAQHVDGDTKKIRKEIEDNGADHVTITPLGRGYGSLRKVGGNFEVVPKVRVSVTDKDTGEIRKYEAYYDFGLRTATTKGGAYMGNYKETVMSGGSKDYGNMTAKTPSFGIGDRQYNGPVQIGAVRQPGLSLPEIGNIDIRTREFNMYPDYNQWTSFGNWDTRESHALSAGASTKLGTY